MDGFGPQLSSNCKQGRKSCAQNGNFAKFPVRGAANLPAISQGQKSALLLLIAKEVQKPARNLFFLKIVEISGERGCDEVRVFCKNPNFLSRCGNAS
jgi:hypothetical protein